MLLANGKTQAAGCARVTMFVHVFICLNVYVLNIVFAYFMY